MANTSILQSIIPQWQANSYSESAIHRLGKHLKDALEKEQLTCSEKDDYFATPVECVVASQTLHILKNTGCFKFGPHSAGLVFELRDCLLALSNDLLLQPSDVQFLQNLKNAKLIYDECQKLSKKLNRKMKQAIQVFSHHGQYYSLVLTLCAYAEHRVVEEMNTPALCGYPPVKDLDDLSIYSVPEIVEALSLLLSVFDEIAPGTHINGLVYGDSIFSKRIEELFLIACKLRFLQEILAANDIFGYKIDVEQKSVTICHDTASQELAKAYRLGYIKRDLAAQNFPSCDHLPSMKDIFDSMSAFFSLEKAENPSRYFLKMPDILMDKVCSVSELTKEEYDIINFESSELNLSYDDIDAPIYKTLSLREYIQFRRLFIIFYYAQTVPLYQKYIAGEINKSEYFQSLIPHFSLTLFQSWDVSKIQKLQEFWELINYKDTNSTLIDLLYQPCLSDNNIVFPLCAISMIGNIGRNVSVLMKRLNKGTNEDGSRDPLVNRLEIVFQRHGIPYTMGCPVRGVTDIDVAFCIQNTVFVAECKKNYHPTDIFESRATIDAIYKAERQLGRIVPALKQGAQASLFQKLQLPPSSNPRIVPLIITGNRIFSNTNHFKFPVRYVGELIQYINEGTINIGGQDIFVRSSGPITEADMDAYLKPNCICFEFLKDALKDTAQTVTIGTYCIDMRDYALDPIALDKYCFERWNAHILSPALIKQMSDEA